MAMTAGTVAVSESGVASYNPNNATNCAKAIYLAFLDSNGSDPDMVPQTTMTPPAVSFAPDGTHALTPATQTTAMVAVTPGPNGDADRKKGFAKLANTLASALVPYLQANAQAKIPNDATGDGLMKDSGGGACQHPAANKFIPIV